MTERDIEQAYGNALNRELQTSDIDARIESLRLRLHREGSVRDLVMFSCSVVVLAALTLAAGLARVLSDVGEGSKK